MRIKKVKWDRHPILGDLELDFTNPQGGLPFDTIVFAGENGTGKTTILGTLSTFLNCGSFEHFDFIKYIVEGNEYKAIQPTSNPAPTKTFFDIIDTGGNKTEVRISKYNTQNPGAEIGSEDIRYHGCVFSKARADYRTGQINYVTTKQLDVDKYDTDIEEDFSSLKQLIIDVANQDNNTYAELNQRLGDEPSMSWPEFYSTSKQYRFKQAFNDFFERLKYENVQDVGEEKVVFFNKNGNKVKIDNLSTGEKQIVFRGIYLLRNNKKLEGAAILIDEPELSLHPKWQKNILNYYKKLFTEQGIQKVQLLLATHSVYVLEDALSKREDNGVIQADKIVAPSVLPTITSAETNYLAFDIISNDYHIELYGWLQENRALERVISCDAYIKNHPLFDAIVHYRSSSFNTTNYNTLSTYIRNAIHHPNQGRSFTPNELRASVELLRAICN